MTDLASRPTLAEPPSATVALPRPTPAFVRGRWWRDALRRRLLALSDLAAAALATSIVVVPATHTWWALAFLPLWPMVAKLLGLYDRDHRALRHLTADEVPAVLAAAAVVTALIALLLPLTPSTSLGGATMGALFAAAAFAMVCLRSLTRWAWTKLTRPELVGLIGDGDALESVHRKLQVLPEMHLRLAAERRTEELRTAERRAQELPALADQVDRIIVAATGVETDLLGELKMICRRRAVKLGVVSPLRGDALPAEHFSRLADLPILEYNTWDTPRSTVVIKRLFDIAVASAGLVLAAPFLGLIAVAIKLDSRGPVLFSQIRAGLNGRPFRMYKLRTMCADAEEQLGRLVNIDGLAEPVFKFRDDPRVTRVGRLLRRFSLDELPQLVNVLVGEMSIVGPRPEQVELVQRYSHEDRFRLTAKPGITGPMQIFGRGELTFAERLAVELEYVENPSLNRDLRIIIHTLPAVLRGTGAF